MKSKHDPQSFLPLPAAAAQILLVLMDSERHGYAIMSDVAAISNGAVKLGPGTLYGTIRRLLADGLIEETESRPDTEMDDQRRRYYQLTSLGEKVAVAEGQRLAALLKKAGWTVTTPARLQGA